MDALITVYLHYPATLKNTLHICNKMKLLSFIIKAGLLWNDEDNHTNEYNNHHLGEWNCLTKRCIINKSAEWKCKWRIWSVRERRTPVNFIRVTKWKDVYKLQNDLVSLEVIQTKSINFKSELQEVLPVLATTPTQCLCPWRIVIKLLPTTGKWIIDDSFAQAISMVNRVNLLAEKSSTWWFECWNGNAYPSKSFHSIPLINTRDLICSMKNRSTQ